MKFILAILTVLMTTSCACKNGNKIEETRQPAIIPEETVLDNWNYKQVGHEHLDALFLKLCATQDLEFIDLYPALDTIARDKYEKLILVGALKSKGFKVSNWGRGNWEKGPRIVNFTLSNEQCECQVDKLYYSTEEIGRYKVTERIMCKELGH